MFFGDRNILITEKLFTQTDLLRYVEMVIRESRSMEKRSLEGHYSWLSSRHARTHDDALNDLEALAPLVRKMLPESCVIIAVKIDALAETAGANSCHILSTFKELLEERDKIQMLECSVRRAKEMKNRKQFRLNRVRPILSPPGREATVSFIID